MAENGAPAGNERTPLLDPENGQPAAPPPAADPSSDSAYRKTIRYFTPRRVVAIILFIAYIVGTIVCITVVERPRLFPRNSHEAAISILKEFPVIDTHIDLPELVRITVRNNASAVDLEHTMPGQVDIPRLRKGRVGGFFWSVYADCPNATWPGKDFLGPTDAVRDTLEQIDIAKALISKYPKTFAWAPTVDSFRTAMEEGKIASTLGIEGAHQLGNSLASLRMFYELGVRYVTLTHMCHNVFADSGGFLEPLKPVHGGLSKFGRTLVEEMNRIGMIVDLSHVSDDTARQVLKLSKAPVIWSHSSARSVWNVARNVPDDILEMIGNGKGKLDGVVQVNFAPYFVADKGNATIKSIADHVDHIAGIAGRKHVGLGSDFDGIGEVPIDLEDVSKYPLLVAELYERGWSRKELAGLAGENLLRVYAGVERVAADLRKRGTPRKEEVYSKRTDMKFPDL